MKMYVAYDAEGKILAAVNKHSRKMEPQVIPTYLGRDNATPKSKCPKNTGI